LAGLLREREEGGCGGSIASVSTLQGSETSTPTARRARQSPVVVVVRTPHLFFPRSNGRSVAIVLRLGRCVVDKGPDNKLHQDHHNIILPKRSQLSYLGPVRWDHTCCFKKMPCVPHAILASDCHSSRALFTNLHYSTTYTLAFFLRVATTRQAAKRSHRPLLPATLLPCHAVVSATDCSPEPVRPATERIGPSPTLRHPDMSGPSNQRSNLTWRWAKELNSPSTPRNQRFSTNGSRSLRSMGLEAF